MHSELGKTLWITEKPFLFSSSISYQIVCWRYSASVSVLDCIVRASGMLSATRVQRRPSDSLCIS